jgi:phosphoglycerol transferase MdoB-like AlkP superfamily enzyme
MYFTIYHASSLQDNLLINFITSSYYGFRLDLSTIAYCVSIPLLVFLIESIFKKNIPKFWFKAYFGLILFIIFVITLADAELYQQWGSKFSNQVLVYIQHPFEMALSAGATNWLKTSILGLILLGILLLIYFYLNKVLTNSHTFNNKNTAIILLIMAFNFILARGGIGVTTISQSSAVYSSSLLKNYSAINSLWNVIYYTINNTDNLYADKFNFLEQNQAEGLFNNQFLPSVIDSIEISNVENPNYIIVLLESFTAAASQFFTNQNNLTPHLDQLSKEHLSFMNCYASGDRTEKGIMSVLSGYPAQPVSSIIVFPDKIANIPSLLRDYKNEKYYTSFIYGGDVEFASMKSYLKLNETDEIIDKNNFASHEKQSKWGANDAALFDKSLKILNHHKNPFFSVILTLSSHEPFDVPYNDPDIPKDKWFPFKNSLKFADKCLLDFIKKCQQQSWYKNTIIVLVADHGHDIGLEDIHYFGKEKYQIPLVFLGGALNPDLKGKQIMNIVSQTIVPSLITQSKNRGNYQWQTSSNHPNGFAQYHFYNGFGRVTQNSEIIFDNESKKAYGLRYQSQPMDFESDSLLLINQGKAFQQILINDLLLR